MEVSKYEMIDFIQRKKVPLLVKHGVIAVFDSSRRVIKQTRRGPYRTSARIPVVPRAVPKTKDGFYEAFNIIIGAFTNYGYLSSDRSKGINLTAKGIQLNIIHQREVDSSSRLYLFHGAYERLYRKDIKEYNLGKVKPEEQLAG